MVLHPRSRRPSRRAVLRGTASVATALAAPSLTACGGSSRTSGGRAKVRLWHWYNQQRHEWPRLIHDFHEERPDIEIENRQFGDPNSYLPALQASVAAGDPPEIFAPHVLGIEYGRAGIAADLKHDLGADFLSQFFTSANEMFTDEGKQYGIGWMAQTFGIFYQPKRFAAARVDVPETWDDLISVAAELRRSGVEPCALSNSPGTNGLDFFLPLITQVTDDPQTLLDLDLQREGANWNSPDVVRALEMVDRLQKEGAFAPNPNGITTEQAERMLYSDKAAMLFMGSWAPQDFELNAPRKFVKEYRVMKTPAWRSGARHWCANQAGASLAVSETSPNKEAALAFIRFMYQTNRYTGIMNRSRSMPATRASAERVTDPVLEEMTSWLLDGDGAPHILFGRGSSESASNAVSLLLGGDSSPKRCAAAIQADVARAVRR